MSTPVNTNATDPDMGDEVEYAAHSLKRETGWLGAFVIGNELKLAVALVLIIGVLVVRPSGFFGRVHVTRV